MANFDALIFDCDGVLVNSEQIAQEIERELLAAAGMQYPEEESDPLQFKLRKTGLDALFGAHVYSADAVGAGEIAAFLGL